MWSFCEARDRSLNSEQTAKMSKRVGVHLRADLA
jgi:hypothetical protein